MADDPGLSDDEDMSPMDTGPTFKVPTFRPSAPACRVVVEEEEEELPFAPQTRLTLGSKKATHSVRHPGYSMFDWNRLCQKKGRGQMSATAGGRLLKITPAELAKHNSETDLWTAVRGKVYNVTEFQQFHPGKKTQLLRGAGNDCTALFDKLHAWVNVESILAPCHVGYLIDDHPPSAGSLLLGANSYVPKSKPEPMDDSTVTLSFPVPTIARIVGYDTAV